MLSKDEAGRYARHFPVIGKEGQERLKKARILVVGAGGLGSPVSMYLAAAGIGTLGIADFDSVQASNLHRQLLHSGKDVGREKTASAKEALERLNPHVKVIAHQVMLEEENVEGIISGYDIVVDGSDSLETKLAVNRACRSLGKPLVYGAAVGMEGQLAVFTGKTGCLACLVKAGPVPSCSGEGVLATTPGVIGVLQAAEALKLALGMEPMEGLLVFDSAATEFRKYSFPRSCKACLGKEQKPAGQKNAMDYEISVQQLKPLLGKVQLLDVREEWEFGINRIEGSRLVPLAVLTAETEKLDKSVPVVCYCHTGARSLYAARYLASAGFNAKSLAGGIMAWIREVQPGMEDY